MSGQRFIGRIVSFDIDGLLLQTNDGQMLIQQRQISTVSIDVKRPAHPVASRTTPAAARVEEHEEAVPVPRPAAPSGNTVTVTRKVRRITSILEKKTP